MPRFIAVLVSRIQPISPPGLGRRRGHLEVLDVEGGGHAGVLVLGQHPESEHPDRIDLALGARSAFAQPIGSSRPFSFSSTWL